MHLSAVEPRTCANALPQCILTSSRPGVHTSDVPPASPGFPPFLHPPPPPPPNLTGCFQINPTVSVCDRELFFGGFLEYSAGFVPPRGSDYIPEKDTKHPGCPDLLLFFLCTSSDCSQWTCGDFHMFMWLVGYGPLPLLLVLFGGHQVIDHTSCW